MCASEPRNTSHDCGWRQSLWRESLAFNARKNFRRARASNLKVHSMQEVGANLSYDVSCTAQYVGDKTFKFSWGKCVHCLKRRILK